MTDIHIRVTQETGELMVFDDDDNELMRCVVEQWIDNKDDDFYEEIASIIRRVIDKQKAQVENMGLLKPYAFVLEDDDKENVGELYVVDDDTVIIDTELMAGLDKDLDDFFDKLLKEESPTLPTSFIDEPVGILRHGEASLRSSSPISDIRMEVGLLDVDAHTLQVLVRKRQLGTKQTDGPRNLYPQHEQRQGGKRAVDGVVARHPYLRMDVEQLQPLDARTGNDARHDGTAPLHVGVGHRDIQADKEQRQQHVGRQVEQSAGHRPSISTSGMLLATVVSTMEKPVVTTIKMGNRKKAAR